MILPLLLLRPSLQAVAEVRGGIGGDFVAVQIETEAEPEIDELLDGWEINTSQFANVFRKPSALEQLTCSFDNSRHTGFANEHVMRFFGQHEARRSGERIERAFRQREQLRLAVTISEHREHEEVEPVLD